MKHVAILLLTLITLPLCAQDVIQWRGTDRTGVYKETGLLKAWPADGPTMLWHYDGVGEGHSSAAIANNKIYVTGLVDGSGHLFVFDLAGKLLNKKSYGPEWDTNYNGARGTVTVNDGRIYVYSGQGGLVCFDESNLNIVWQKNVINEYQGSNIRWGVNESPLIVGDKVIITPGGTEHNVMALNKKTGDVIWSCCAPEQPAT